MSDVRAQNTTSLASIKTVNEAANQAVEDAAIARQSAETAKADAATAKTSADAAKTSADSAHTSAQSALRGLSQVEDVVGTLNWISEHGTYVRTEDTAVQEGKIYYTKDGDSYSIVTEPTGNPSEQGYYELELDEAVSNYVQSHLALTDEGLYILSDTNGWKVLIKNDGVYIVNADGEIVSRYGKNVIVGLKNSSHVEITNNSFIILNEEGTAALTARSINDNSGTSSITENLTDLDKLKTDSAGNDIQLYNTPKSSPKLTMTLQGYDTSTGELTTKTYSGYTDIDDLSIRWDGARDINVVYSGSLRNRRVKYDAGSFYSNTRYIIVDEGFSVGTDIIINVSISRQDATTQETITIPATFDGAEVETTKSGLYVYYNGWGTLRIGNTYSGNWNYWNVSYTENVAEVDVLSATAEYEIDSTLAWTYTFGTRDPNYSKGAGSLCVGYGLNASELRQVVFGKYNTPDQDALFMIGNGIEAKQNNAFAVTDDDIKLYLDTNAGSGTDYEIYSALQALGWTDCIV